MGRFSKSGVNSEEFHEAMKNAGPVECWVKDCQVKIGQGNKGQSICVCEECIGYYCNDHIFRHPNCSEGR